MFHGVFTVRYITAKNCFCFLSEQNSKYLEHGVTLKLSYGNDKVAFLSAQPLSGLNEDVIGLNRLQAQALGLLEHESVMVDVSYNVPGIRRLTVSPTTKEDYEILELMAENLESTLLNQIRVVNENQKFVIWVTDSLHVTVNVDVADPITPGRLDNFTEVLVAVPKSEIGEVAIKNSKSASGWGFHKLFSYFNKSEHDSKDSSPDVLDKFSDFHLPLGFTLRCVDDLSNFVDNGKLQYFNVFAYEEHLPKKFRERVSPSDIFNLNIIIPPVVNNSFMEENNMAVKTVVVRLCILENNVGNETFKNGYLPILYMHQCIFKHFDMKVGSKGYLVNFVQNVPSVNSIEISTIKEFSKSAIEHFKSYINKNCQDGKVLLNSDIVLKDSEFPFSLKFEPTRANFCSVDSDFVRNCRFAVADTELAVIQPEAVQNKSTCNVFEDFGNFKDIVEDSVNLLQVGLMNKGPKPENVLLVGKPGTGKSTLIKTLSTKLFNSPLYIHSEIISCKNIKGKSLDSLHRVFSSKLINLVYYQPSVLIFDDLNIICEKVSEGDALTPEALHFNRVSEMIAGMLDNILSKNKIAVLATSESVLKLNQHIFASRGLHLFKNVFTINELTKNGRLSILNFLFSRKCELKHVDLELLAQKTEGFVGQDLVDFADKAVFESLKEEFSERPDVTMTHCEASLLNTTALSLKDVQLHSPGDRDFNDIGGLEDVKKVLVECMMWPVQYPNLFEKAPLRLQSGLLLYGPPGTGKTILAGAAARHCGLRLISIKGPELLSKYIGASEQAVRNVFEKAQSAKPCILFFDEFDSLAPRRGHDSTGVTDRVVNQLLTQLDGIESLSGVCVLAATSRPDLLDPALLRPGRLDRQILCPLPHKESRLKILTSLSKKMTFASDVNLQKIAEKTNSYSGADLQAILYTAQLSAVEYILDQSKGKPDDVIEINQSHLDEALKNTRPSLTKEENLKFKRIYAKFQHGSDLIDIKSGSQRATLA